jgi:hypothetical protein
MAMKTTQGWGWLAAGVLALGLNGIYHDGGAAYLHGALAPVIARVAQRTGPVLALATGRADLFMERTGMMAARSETASCRLATAMARVHSKVSRSDAGWAQLEEMTARQEAAMARMEANRARIEAQMERARFLPASFDADNVRMNCARVRVEIPRVDMPRINIPKIPVVKISDSVVEVGDPI